MSIDSDGCSFGSSEGSALDCGNQSEPALLNRTLWKLQVPIGFSAFISSIYVLIFLVAVTMNVLIIGFIIYKKKLKKPSFVFLFCLAVIDLLEAISTVPFYIVTHVKGEWIIGETDAVRSMVCSMVGFYLSIFLSSSVYMLGIISVDRFLYIVCAFRYKRIMKPWSALLIVIVVFIFPLAISTTPFYGFGEFFFFVAAGVCLFRWRGSVRYLVTYCSVVLIPIVVLFIFTLVTYCYVRRYLRGDKRVGVDTSLTSQKEKSEHTKVLNRMFGFLLLVQVICFFPGFLTAFIGSIVDFRNVPDALLIIDFVLVLSNAALNPIVQALVWREFRVALWSQMRRVFCFCCCCCCSSEKKPSQVANNSGVSTGSSGLSNTSL